MRPQFRRVDQVILRTIGAKPALDQVDSADLYLRVQPQGASLLLELPKLSRS